MAVVTYHPGSFFSQLERVSGRTFLIGDPSDLLETGYIAFVTPDFGRVFGTGLTYDAFRHPNGGTINRLLVDFSDRGGGFEITGLNFSAARFTELLPTDSQWRAEILGGADTIIAMEASDIIRGYGGDDSITAAAGNDNVDGGAGSDTVSGGAGADRITDSGGGANYLRGDDGDDFISGGVDFDDINGNMGNDTAQGGLGHDWVVGGKDNDSLSGGADYDLVYGNLGADTCDGGEGNDIIRGGQDNDVVRGGDGDDYVSGDRGDDTMTGDAGADTFHSFGEAGIDRVTDFSLVQGDRVQLDPGTQYTLAQVGADTVISMTGGGQMILVDVQLSTLTPGWIFGF
ncbi:calcium-binding protein [Phenylobacterium sp.]|uniref:calcium-binding protein n=1 Tax=Phenylobacterium sp. TaxID=1871053 RepID=UPI0025D47D93|nr:calcium-binding protein [Phenylobacterium sp.]